MNLVRLFNILSKKEKVNFILFFLIFFIGMLLELLGIALILPFLEIVLNDNINEIYRKKLESFNINLNSKNQLIIFGIYFLLIIYTLKSLFLMLVPFVQTKFLYNIKSQVSNKLFKIYLLKPFSFHLNTNSALLIRNLNDSSHIIIIFRSISLYSQKS